MTARLTLDTPDDPDEKRLDAAIHEYLMAAEAGPVDGPAWLRRQATELRPRLAEFLDTQQAVARLRKPPARTVPLALPDFGRYSRLRLVGKGGMGAVYRARDSVLERTVAVKAIHADLAAEREDAERFLREARVVARLQHRNIVSVYDYGMMPGSPPRPYFTMQLIESGGEDHRGPSMLAAAAGYHAAPTATRLQALVTAFLGVCDAIAHAHSVDVLHRDLKPSNVLLIGDRDVLVVDWGLGKVQKAGAPHTTGLGGTPEYMPPEVAGGSDVGKPADVFGLGGILAVLLTGHPVYVPVKGQSAYEMVVRADTAGCVDRLRGSGHPPELIELAERCLAVDPAERPTAEQAAAEAAGYLASVEERAKAAEIEAAKAVERATAERSRRRLQGLLALAATVMIGTVGVGTVWYVNDRAERRRQDDLAAQARHADERDRAARVREAAAAGVAALAEQRFDAAAAALERARGALGAQPPDDLRGVVAEAEGLLKSAVQLDEIRQELAVRRTDPQLPDEPVVERYAAAFAGLGIDPAAPDAVERVAASPLRGSLVIALDDWAQHRYSTATTGGVPAVRLLEVARGADPDPAWRDQFRDPAVRGDRTRLSALAAAAPVDQLTIAQTTALVAALPLSDPNIPRLLTAAEARHPNDYWLCLTAAKWRLQSLRVGVTPTAAVQDTIAYARTASALRPDSLAALLLLAELYDLFNLPAGLDAVAARVTALGRDSWMTDYVAAVAARKRMKYKEALRLLVRVSEAAGNPPDHRPDIALMHIALGEYDKARGVIDGILAGSPRAVTPRACHAMLLALAGQSDEAERESRALLAEAPTNTTALHALAFVLLAKGRLDAAATLARVFPKTGEDSASLYIVNLFVLLHRGDYAGVLATVEQLEQYERNATTGIFRFLALAGLGRFKEAKAALDDTAKRQADAGSPLSAALRMYSLAVPVLQMHVAQAVKWEEQLGATAPQPDRTKIDAATGLERIAFLHVADVFLAKGWAGGATMTYRAILADTTPLSGVLARNSWAGQVGSYRFSAIRAAAVTSAGGGRDGFRSTDKDRAECRADALRWLKAELDQCKEHAGRKSTAGGSLATLWDGGSPASANFRLHLLKWHPDLDPVRNPAVIAEMPEADRKLATEVWAGVDELYRRLNPPLNIPGIPER